MTTTKPRPFRRPALRVVAAGVLMVALAGCVSMAPRLVTPAPSVPAHWDADAGKAGQAAATLTWHNDFADPVLQQLIDTAMANNRDLHIVLTGGFGSASAAFDGLFKGGSRAWAFAPTLSLPILDGGSRRADLDLAKVSNNIAVARYEKSSQTAFREVADALAARRWLVELRDAQRDLLDAQQQPVQVRRAQLSSQVVLYQALGGGALPASRTPTS